MPLPVNFGGFHKRRHGHGITYAGNGKEVFAEDTARRVFSKALKKLLDDWSASDEIQQFIRIEPGTMLTLEQIDPNGSVHQDHFLGLLRLVDDAFLRG